MSLKEIAAKPIEVTIVIGKWSNPLELWTKSSRWRRL